MASIDVTVWGAGVIGLSVALACLQRGARVQVIDPQGPGAGASGGIVGALAPHTPDRWNPKKALQFDSLILSRRFWPWVEARSGLPTGYGATGRVQPLLDDRAVALAQARAEDARINWQGLADWVVTDTPGPWAPPSPTGHWLVDTLTARLYPAQATQALAGAVRALGGTVGPDGPEVGQVVHATGVAGLTALSAGRARPLGNGVKGQAALVDLDRRAAPQLFIDGIHIVPHADGTTAIGSTSERVFDSPTDTDAQLDDLLERAQALVPALAGRKVLQRWAGLRPRARSRAPMVGPWPDRPGHWVANGGFKIGFGMAPILGDLLADALLTGEDQIPEMFRVEASL